MLCVSPGRLTLSPLTALPDTAFSHCGLPLTPWDLAVVYAVGPVCFLASMAACLALGSVLTACRARRRRAAAAPPPAETSELQPEPGLACEPWEPRCHRPSLSGPRGCPPSAPNPLPSSALPTGVNK